MRPDADDGCAVRSVRWMLLISDIPSCQQLSTAPWSLSMSPLPQSPQLLNPLPHALTRPTASVSALPRCSSSALPVFLTRPAPAPPPASLTSRARSSVGRLRQPASHARASARVRPRSAADPKPPTAYAAGAPRLAPRTRPRLAPGRPSRASPPPSAARPRVPSLLESQ